MPSRDDAPLPSPPTIRSRAAVIVATLAFIMALTALVIAMLAYGDAQEALKHANDATTGAREVKIIEP